jgi:hypothetical protein
MIITGLKTTFSRNCHNRDDPSEMPNFVAINDAKIDGRIMPKGENLFAALKLIIIIIAN